MLVKVTDVSCRDSFHGDKSDLVGCVFEVHETDLIAWSDGWFGMDKCRLVSDCSMERFVFMRSSLRRLFYHNDQKLDNEIEVPE